MVFLAFLDAIDRITILVDKNIYLKEDFIINNGGDLKKLDIIEKHEEDSWYKYILNNPDILDMTKDIYILNGEYKTMLHSGGFIRDPRFDEIYSYDGELGVLYTEHHTTFRIWSPVAKEIVIELITTKDKLMIQNLNHMGKGLWEVTINGNLEGTKYRYRVRVFDDFRVINDPYGISSDANGNFNYVVDVNKFRKFRYTKPNFSGKYTDAIIYEASVRDLTSKLNIPDKMRFKGLCQKLLTKNGHAAGLDYIATLGITHLQLMPIFDFYGISDKNPERYYNWGYNPIQYFVPKGAYSTNPDDPYARINELIELIDMCHAYGLLVNMDVVYNHVNDMKKFPFDTLVPGYYFRTNNGYTTNVSGCGNDLATERKMCSKFIVDNLLYLQKTYHISGFRFDLMGLLDIKTMNDAAVLLKANDQNVMLYGEGWNMPNTLPDNQRPHSLNYRYIPDYAFFNDRFRDFFKGSQWNKTLGYLFNNNCSTYDLYHLLTGSSLDYFCFDSPLRTINYIECHDNYTVYDYFKEIYKKGKEQEYYSACKLGLALVILSIGVPFIHAGQEFLRTKKGVENSYNSGDFINGIDWEQKDTYRSLVQTTRDLIRIRKQYSVFRISSVKEINEKISLVNEYSDSNNFVYKLSDEEEELYVIIKSKKEKTELKFNDAKMIFDGSRITELPAKKIVLKQKGLYIVRKDKK